MNRDIYLKITFDNWKSGTFPTYRLHSSPFKNTLLWSFVASYISMVAICESHSSCSSTYSILNTISSTYITSSHIYDQQIHREIGLIPTYGNKIRKGTVKEEAYGGWQTEERNRWWLKKDSILIWTFDFFSKINIFKWE